VVLQGFSEGLLAPKTTRLVRQPTGLLNKSSIILKYTALFVKQPHCFCAQLFFDVFETGVTFPKAIF
jgi:hypothetical protein